MTNTVVNDIVEEERISNERTMNYIQFQISQADEMLAPFANTEKSKIYYGHLLEWKKELQTELHELRKVMYKARQANK